MKIPDSPSGFRDDMYTDIQHPCGFRYACGTRCSEGLPTSDRRINLRWTSPTGCATQEKQIAAVAPLARKCHSEESLEGIPPEESQKDEMFNEIIMNIDSS